MSCIFESYYMNSCGGTYRQELAVKRSTMHVNEDRCGQDDPGPESHLEAEEMHA
jgi:hypothetical protein